VNLLKIGLTETQISQTTGLTLEDIEKAKTKQ